MHQQLLELTEKAEHDASKLLTAYDPETLYEFRVGSRRIRSILKHIGSHRARGFRKAWGGFTAVTNEARDWDVFLLTAEKLLTPAEIEAFSSLNRERISSCHEAVTEMLNSALWLRHLDDWKRFLLRAAEDAPAGEHSLAALQLALTGAREALRRALDANDDRHWHKFRIAIKEVRYVADASSVNAANEKQVAEVIVACKTLQALLGDWHDTVVQLNLLEELQAAPVHDRLAELIAERQQQFLTRTRALVERTPLFALQGSLD
jgi:CHAD domain-containing protein